MTNTLTRSLLFFLAIACGVTVANLYYCQPLLIEMQNEFKVSVSTIGRIPMLTQIGYAVGMLFLTPLGDKLNRKVLIFIASLASGISLFFTANCHSFIVFELVSFLVGVSSIGAQFMIPLVAQLAPDSRRGEAVGKVMTGLLLGILLARSFSGFIGATWGWRQMYYLSSAWMLLLATLAWFILPRTKAVFHGSYLKLIGSMIDLVSEEPILRESALIGGCLFASFCALWATLIFHMGSDNFHLGAKAVGLFGLLGAAGAAAASLVGKIADRVGPLKTLQLALFCTFVSFIELAFFGYSLLGLSVGIFCMDAGVQSAHVSNQSRFYKLRPEARSRMNTIYMFVYFTGGALGSILGTWCWHSYQWKGVCSLSILFVALAILIATKSHVKRNRRN